MRCWRRSLLSGLILVASASVAPADDATAPAWWRGAAKAAADHRPALAAKAGPLLADGSPALQQARLRGEGAPDTVRAVAVMVAFADTCFFGHPDDDDGALPNSTQGEIDYAAHDSVFYDHLLGDVADYYAAVSGGRFTLDYHVHAEVLDLAEPMAYYGDHPEEGEQPVVLATDALAAADHAIDFSVYDTVILIHAGAGEETDAANDSPEQIYSSYLGVEDFAEAVEDSVLAQPYLPTDDHPEGEGVRHVLILPECEYQDPSPGSPGMYGSLGVYCFELGLRLGMLSLFDFTGNDSQGIGQFGLMGFGLWSAGGLIPPQPCAFNKVLMGWLDPYRVDPARGETWTLNPSEFPAEPQTCARVDLTGAEYFLLEYRREDPDGNGEFSFDEGDLNGDDVPNFFDADAPTDTLPGVPRPGAVFDPDEDQHERLIGAEWDFFLTGSRGAGTGLLIWHVDEGVIRAVWDAERNLFNGDPARKSVDLEEADGIQDLDVREGGAFWLGAYVDTWKGEGNATFGPDTRPDTRTNGEAPTGLVVDRISDVVDEDSHVFNPGEDDEYVGILYHEFMTFRCRRDDAPDAPPAMIGRDLVGVDITGSHLRAALLAVGDARPTAVVAADSGRVYAFGPELAEHRDHDADPATFAPLATGTDDAGEPVAWLPPPALGQLAADDTALEIVLAAPRGVYAFRHDGTPVRTPDVPGVDHGLLAAVARVTLPPVLLPVDGDGPRDPVLVCVGTVDETLDGAPTRLRFVATDGSEPHPPLTLAGLAAAAPVRADRTLYVPVVGPDGQGLLQAVSWPRSGDPAVLWTVDLDLVPGPRPPAVSPTAVLVSDAEGRGQTVYLGDGSPRVGDLWGPDVVVRSSLGAGGAFLAEGRLGRIGETGAWQTGWPRVPLPATASGGAEPLALGDPAAPAGFLFAARDGRLYLTDTSGETAPGWPLAVPADQVCTPLVVAAPAEADGNVTFVVAGVTPEVAGVDPETASLVLRPVTRLRAWSSALAVELVPTEGMAMYGGSPAGRVAVGPLVPADDAAAAGGLEASHVCYPQPLRGGVLKVRATAADGGEARAVIYDLQGEVVARVGPRTVPAGVPFELAIALDGVASGLYLCKLQVADAVSVKTIAVTR